jgi:hypothetical protein
VLETVRKQLEKESACAANSSSAWHTGLSGGSPDNVRWCTRKCPVCQAGSREKAALGTQWRRTAIIHRTVRWCTGLSGESSAMNSSPSGKAKGQRGYNSPDSPVVHRTVRWCTGLSGEPMVASANGRPRNFRATRGRANGRQGAPNCPVRTVQCPVRQQAQSCNGQLCSVWKGIAHRTGYSSCLVANRTIRCATRQKARMAFQVCLQRLLAALGL